MQTNAPTPSTATAAGCTSTSPPRAAPTTFTAPVRVLPQRQAERQLLLRQQSGNKPTGLPFATPRLPFQPVRLDRRRPGSNKVFWFFNFEGLRQRTPTTYRFTVPTALQRLGDFSQTFNAAGTMMQIADPLTTTASGVRMPFRGTRSPPTASIPSRPMSSPGIPIRIWPATRTTAPTTISLRCRRLTMARTTPRASIPTLSATGCLSAGRTTRASRGRRHRGISAAVSASWKATTARKLHRTQRRLDHQPHHGHHRSGGLHALDPGRERTPPSIRGLWVSPRC